MGIAACLANKDAVSPLLVIACGGLLNLCLDLALVPRQGIGGAAWATLASELAAAAAISAIVWCRTLPAQPETTSPPPDNQPIDLQPIDQPRRRRSILPALLPARSELAEFGAFGRPLIVSLLGKICTYSMLAHVATSMGVVATAAHRVLMCVYWFSCGHCGSRTRASRLGPLSPSTPLPHLERDPPPSTPGRCRAVCRGDLPTGAGLPPRPTAAPTERT